MEGLAAIASILGSIIIIWKYGIQRRKQIWAWFKKRGKGKYEDNVDKTVTSRDSSRMGKFVRKHIIGKRNKRNKTS